MNAKQITEQNIIANGYRLGKSIRGKGVELFDAEKNLVGSWNLEMYPEKVEEVLTKLEEADLSELYVSQIRYVSKGDGSQQSFKFRNVLSEQKNVNLSKLIETRFKGIEHINIQCVPSTLLGHFPISKYKADLESQKEMIINLLRFDGVDVLEDQLEECEYDLDTSDTMEFNYHSGSGSDSYYNGDYGLTHGNASFFPDTNSCEYVEGRPEYHNSQVLEDFWNSDYEECLKPYLSELDPKSKMCVYHRKGKDWYVGAQYETLDIPIIYRDEDKYAEAGEVEETTFYALTYQDDTELTEKFVEVLKSYRDDVAMKSYINNELETGEGAYGGDYYNDGIVNQKLVKLLYEDMGDLEDEIKDSIEKWELDSIKEEFRAAYQKAIDARVKVTENLKVEVTTTPMYNGSSPRVPSVKSYNHLKILKALEKRFGYELIQSMVSNNIDTVAWVLKRDGEEYHFDIASVIADDLEEEVSLREFIVSALEALAKRKIEKLSQAELFEKASRVFIGIEDSLLSGNCSFGTNQFIAKHHIDTSKIGGIRGDLLLEMEKSNFTMRAITYALASHGGIAC